jgi:hypothetical protein
MRFDKFSFGSLQIDDSTYEHDVVIDRGKLRDRKKKPSKKFRDEFGHTPLSVEEDIPWKCARLVIGTGAYGRMPVMGRSRARGEASQSQIADFADDASYRDTAGRTRRHQRDPPRDVLSAAASTPQNPQPISSVNQKENGPNLALFPMNTPSCQVG